MTLVNATRPRALEVKPRKETPVGRFVVRRDHPHTKGWAGQPGGLADDSTRRDGVGVGVVERVAQLVGVGKRVLIFGPEVTAAAMARTLEARNCGTVVV